MVRRVVSSLFNIWFKQLSTDWDRENVSSRYSSRREGSL